METWEDVYNSALELLKSGHSKEEVLLKYPKFQTELAPLLEITSSLMSLPKNQAPRPAMQRKYILAPSKGFWLNWIHVSKFAGISMSLMLLLSAFSVTGYATFKSSPGQSLFLVKKSAEKLQLILAYNQSQKANIQLQITQSRLNEAKEIFSNPSSNVAQKTAALSELSDQTSNAVTVVNSVTKNNPQSEKNHPLVDSLESIASEQKNLLTDIKPEEQIQVAANNALETLSQNSVKISEIKEQVAIASNEQTLAKLNADPNSVTVLGEITQISATQITVENTAFSITTQTAIKNTEGKAINTDSLKLKTKVNIIGLKNKEHLLAEQIVITEPGEVKGAITINSSATPTPDSIKNSVKTSTSSSSSTTSIPVNPNNAAGSFILEDPTPQFTP